MSTKLKFTVDIIDDRRGGRIGRAVHIRETTMDTNAMIGDSVEIADGTSRDVCSRCWRQVVNIQAGYPMRHNLEITLRSAKYGRSKIEEALALTEKLRQDGWVLESSEGDHAPVLAGFNQANQT